MADFLEKNLEDIIYQNRSSILERGFPIHEEHMIRQLRLPCGMVIDLFSFELKNRNEINCTIFELKRDVLTPDTLIQVANYFYEINALLQSYFDKIKISNVVVGNDFGNEFSVLYELMPNVDAYVYKYSIDGISFKRVAKSFTQRDELFFNDSSKSGAYLLNILMEKIGHQSNYIKSSSIED